MKEHFKTIKSFQNQIQTRLQKHGGLKEVIEKKGFLTIIDFIIASFQDRMSRRWLMPCGPSFGFFHALLRSRGIDQWSRYTRVTGVLRNNGKKLSILDVGSGGRGLLGFLNQMKRNSEVFLLDVRKDVFKNLKKMDVIVGDGCSLPFSEKAFDLCVCVDTVEHIPKSTRPVFFEEMKRVHRQRVIITCPIQSNDGLYQGRAYDFFFQHFFRIEKGFEEPNTAQHISCEHPTLEEIKRYFPNSRIYGYKNCDIWLKYMLFSRKTIIGCFCGLLYYLFWKKADKKPPYWGAIIVSD